VISHRRSVVWPKKQRKTGQQIMSYRVNSFVRCGWQWPLQQRTSAPVMQLLPPFRQCTRGSLGRQLLYHISNTAKWNARECDVSRSSFPASVAFYANRARSCLITRTVKWDTLVLWSNNVHLVLVSLVQNHRNR